MSLFLKYKEKCIDAGREEGHKKGCEEGSWREKLGFAKKLLRKQFASNEISELTGLPVERITQLEQELLVEQQ